MNYAHLRCFAASAVKLRRGGRRLCAAALLSTLMMVGCTDPLGPPPDDVRAFARSEGLTPVRKVETVFRVPESDVLFFRVTFGPRLDCPSGCFYATALGLQHAGQVGWLEVPGTPYVYHPNRQSHLEDRSGRRYFVVQPTQDDLFSDVLLDRLLSDERLYSTFAAYLAADEATPEPALLRLAERLPAGWSHTAVLLATHPNALCSRAVQERLLQVSEPAFARVRAIAAETLASMPERCP